MHRFESPYSYSYNNCRSVGSRWHGFLPLPGLLSATPSYCGILGDVCQVLLGQSTEVRYAEDNTQCTLVQNA